MIGESGDSRQVRAIAIDTGANGSEEKKKKDRKSVRFSGLVRQNEMRTNFIVNSEKVLDIVYRDTRPYRSANPYREPKGNYVTVHDE